MSCDIYQLTRAIRKLAAFIIMVGFAIGLLLPVFVHSFFGLIFGPFIMAIGMIMLVGNWFIARRDKWKP